VIKLQRFLWPKTIIICFINGESIEAGFGYIEKDRVAIEIRRKFEGKKREEELVEWYEYILQTYPKTYVATMLDSTNQGAIFGCSKQELQKFDIDSSLVHSLCIDNSWLVYVSLIEMKWFEKKYKSLTFDFIFSPFVMLYEKIKHNLSKQPILAVLHHSGIVYVSVFSEDGLWFSKIVTVTLENALEEDVLEDIEDEDDGLAFDLDSLDADIEPIGEVDTLDEFKEDTSSNETDEKSEENELELLEYDLKFFDTIKSSIENFYHCDLYRHEFLDTIYIYDINGRIGKEIERYIQDELYMSCTLQSFDPIETIGKLAYIELGSTK